MSNEIHPLLIAAKHNDIERAEVLLKAGADINVRSAENTGITPLMIASAFGNLKMVKLLLLHNPDLTLTHHELGHCGELPIDCTALDYAVYYGHPRIAALICKHAVSIKPLKSE